MSSETRRKKYEGSAKGKDAAAKRNARYRESPKGKEMLRRSNTSEGARVRRQTYRAKVEGYFPIQGHVPSRPADGLCQCCGNEPTRKQGLVLDHAHDREFENFRGWLCNNCNSGIGMLGDSVEGLKKALEYLGAR